MAKEILTFWDHTHPLAELSRKLSDQLIPDCGACETLQGELLRSATKIHYDWFNNGWGCNNWSGAVRVLEQFYKTLPVQLSEDRIAEFEKSLTRVYQFSHGERVRISDSSAVKHVTKIVAFVVELIEANKTPIKNPTNWCSLNERHYS